MSTLDRIFYLVPELFICTIRKYFGNEPKFSSFDQKIIESILNVNEFNEKQWNFLVQDFLFYVSRDNMKERIIIEGHSVYKISMGSFLKQKEFKNIDPIKDFEEKGLVVMHGNTKQQQGKHFRENPEIGDFIYVTYGQHKLGGFYRITSEYKSIDTLENNDLKQDSSWGYREVELIKKQVVENTYSIKGKSLWMPSGNSTFRKIDNIKEANQLLFNDYYGIELIDKFIP